LRTVEFVKRHSDLIDAATLRRISVEASCDPRTIIAVLKGNSKRGLAYERAKAALESAGFQVPALNDGKQTE
jgi:hypothetical protein